MILKVLAVGDVVGENGIDYLNKNLRKIKKQNAIHFTVVNGENSAGVGILPRHAEQILDAGADVITLGNHTWNKLQIVDYLDSHDAILRPDNYAGKVPGRGWGVYTGPSGIHIGVINLMGRYELDSNLENPFLRFDRIMKDLRADIILVDFHAEASSEKLAFGYYVDGRASAVWGTHTHVPTADQCVFPKGTGYCTDLGMTGPAISVLGITPEASINLFLGGLPRRFQAATGPCKMNTVIFSIDSATGKCISAERVDIQEP